MTNEILSCTWIIISTYIDPVCVRMSVNWVLVFPLSVKSVENLPTVFGSNNKAQTAAKTVFDLAHRHGDILREGWKNIMDSMLQLFRSKLLPKAMVEVRTTKHSILWLVDRECFLQVVLPSTVHCSNTMLVASGGGFCGAQWEDISSKRGNTF